jgi:diguanylate cyclase (GGDEF)-like protein/PAS domain S-box-containing protein
MSPIRGLVSQARGILPKIPFRAQTVLIVAVSIVSVSTLLIAIQAQSIRQQVLAERSLGIERVARSLQQNADYAADSGGRDYQRADLQKRLPDITRQIGADAVVISDSRGLPFSASEASLMTNEFDRQAADEVLRTGSSLVRQQSAESLVYTLPFRLAGDEPAVFQARVDQRALLAAISTATTGSILPSIIVLLLAVPLAGYVSNRILAGAYEREQLLRVEARFGSLVRNSSDVVAIVAVDGNIQYVSPSLERVLGFGQADAQDVNIFEMLDPGEVAGARAFLAAVAEAPGTPAKVEWRLRHQDGSWRDFEILCANLTADPAVRALVLNGRDVSDRKALEQQLAHQAFHDPLTNLANRALFQDRVDQALARVTRTDGSLAVLFLDLDDFKTVNDSLGHQAGDVLLVEVAERLVAAARASDTVARLGGDEFAILLEGVAEIEIRHVTDRIAAAVRAPIDLDGRQVFVTVSIGIAPTWAGLKTTQELLQGADVAMYSAKNRGKGLAKVFEGDMHANVVSRLTLDADLRGALERGEFSIHYQPIVELRGQRLVGLEALVRWHHPTRGLVPPDQFIPMAEETGLITAIGKFVLDGACRQARAWQVAYPLASDLSISVNLSASQIQDGDIVGIVQAGLEQSGLSPERLILEVTESVLMHDTATALARIVELKELGVRIAIDDFGTGYSSLAYLRRFAVDILKIDKSFVDNVASRTDSMALVRAIVDLGRSLRLTTVAEGVELPEQAAELKALGCDMAQGFLFARPLDAANMEQLLAGLTEGADGRSQSIAQLQASA